MENHINKGSCREREREKEKERKRRDGKIKEGLFIYFVLVLPLLSFCFINF